MRRGEIWWANLREPLGSEPGYRRPVVIVSTDAMNTSSIQMVIVAVLTTNVSLAASPGNVLVSSEETGLSKISVVNVSQVVAVDKGFLSEYIGALGAEAMRRISDGLRLVMAL